MTLIKPSALDTPYREHARSFLGAPGKNPPPVYAVRLAAEAILYAAECPTREITVGGGGRALAAFGQALPALAEPLLAWATPLLSRGGEPAPAMPADALHKPGRGLRERVPYFGVRQTSLYTAAQMRPRATAAALFTAGVFVALSLSVRDRLRLHHVRRATRRKVRAEYEAQPDA